MKKEMLFEELECFISISGNARHSIPSLKKFFKTIKDMGYTGITIGMTDIFELPNEPYFGYLRFKYTKEELQELDRYGKEIGLNVTPHFQHLGHVGPICKYDTYYQFADAREVFLEGDERTYALVDKIFKFMSEAFSTDKVHIGMDEAFMMGRGNHLDKHGFESYINILSRHLLRVREIATKYGYKRFEMWSDMYLHGVFDPSIFTKSKAEVRELVKDKLPSDVALSHWGYIVNDPVPFTADLEKHFLLTDNVNYTGAAITWVGYVPDNEHSMRVLTTNLGVCRKFGVKKINVSIWSSGGCEAGLFTGLPAIYFAAEYTYGRATCKDDIDKNRFKELVGVDFDEFMKLDLANKPHPDYKYDWPSSKSYFYSFSDALLGNLDGHLSANTNADYLKLYEQIKDLKGGEYQYIFDMIINLTKILSNKAELGLNMQKAYKENDKNALKDYAKKVIPTIINDFKSLYQSIIELDKNEFTQSGFEIVNYRFGGAFKRLDRIAKRIMEFVDGKVDSIPELEAERLPIKTFNLNPNENNYLLFGWNILTSFGYST